MIKIIPNQVVCKNCMAKLEYESSDVIKTITKYPNIEIEPDDDILLGFKIVNGYKEVSQKYIECPICKTKIIL
jgi:DNA-directed RNA polymerase subunit RPC12/RpoP